eukprot:GFKZ01002682.1.p1 GENE.GFKZ01002682.1~~GFKZ01002682.1.p1  ORF type:complete len:616 (-),score=78.78 GFKZ01002682.1:1792-3465(-)
MAHSSASHLALTRVAFSPCSPTAVAAPRGPPRTRPRNTDPRPIVALPASQNRRSRLARPDKSRRAANPPSSPKSKFRQSKPRKPKKAPSRAASLLDLNVSAELATEAHDEAEEGQILPSRLADYAQVAGRADEITLTEALKQGAPKPRMSSARGMKGSMDSDSDLEQSTNSNRNKREAKLREKKAAEKAFLEEQLEQRRKENLSKKMREPTRTRKRTRAITPAVAHMKKSAALKDTFQAYMDEISRGDLLDQGEVMKLAKQIKQAVRVEKAQRTMESRLGKRPSVPELAETLGVGAKEVQRMLMAGTAAKNTLVSANLRLVTSVARKVALTKSANSAGIALDDMVQEGSVGLIRAAEKFDVDKGYKFSTYATWWIRAYVMRSITQQSRSIKVPGSIVEEYSKIRKQYLALQSEGIFEPSDADVAKRLGITPAKLRFVVNVVNRVPTSLDISLSPDGDSANNRSLCEVIEGNDHVEARMVEEYQRKELDVALQECLRPIERAVVRLRFGLDDGQPRTLKETGLLLGLSKERIRQLIYQALPKMRTPKIERMLLDATTR